MQNDFYTSTEVSTITGCSRRQLQYWRDKGVVVPTVNPSGKGRNVYYSIKELLALTLMHRLLSLGLSFEPSVQVLEMLQRGETWLFGESLEPSQSKRWMIALGIKDYSPAVLNFDRDVALEMIERGGGILDLASDSIYKHLKQNLAAFKGEVIPSSDDYLSAGGQESVVFGRDPIAAIPNSEGVYFVSANHVSSTDLDFSLKSRALASENFEFGIDPPITSKELLRLDSGKAE